MNIEELQKFGVEVYEDLHFVYTKGGHGSGYANHRRLGKKGYEDQLSQVAYALLRAAIIQSGFDINKPIAVVGPETLGADLAKAAVEAYNEKHDCSDTLKWGTFSAVDKMSTNKTYRWANLESKKLMRWSNQIIWIDDLMTSGSTWFRTQKLVQGSGLKNKRVAVAVITDRSQKTAEELGVFDFVYLAEVPMVNYAPNECPLCAEKRPIVTNIGHGDKYQEEYPDYPGKYITV